MNWKGLSGNRDYRATTIEAPFRKNKDGKDNFEEFSNFLEIINLFSDSARKPFKTSVLNSRSLSEFITSSSYTKFNTDFFEFTIGKKMTSHDKNNLILIRGIVDHNYELLLRLFNEAPIFISRKLGIHHLSQRYFSFKVLLLCSSLGNPYTQMNEDIPRYLENQLEDDTIIKNVMGIDKDFFSSICAAEGGDFAQFIKYLAVKDPKFYPMASIFCWLNLPFIAHVYDPAKGSEGYGRSTISALLMYGLFILVDTFLTSNSTKKLDLGKEFKEYMSMISEYLKENIKEGLNFYFEEMYDRPVNNVSWFTIELKDIWNGINEDFCEILLSKHQEKKEDIKLEEITRKFKTNFVDTLYQKAVNAVTSYIESSYLRENVPDDNLKFFEPIFKFFPSFMFATSGLAKFGLLDGLIEEAFDSENDNIGNFLTGFLIKEKKEEEKDDVDKKKKETALSQRICAQRDSLKLIMIGFEMIEKSRLGTDSKAKDKIYKLLEEM